MKRYTAFTQAGMMQVYYLYECSHILALQQEKSVFRNANFIGDGMVDVT